MTHIPSTTTRGACFAFFKLHLRSAQNAGDYLKQVKASRPWVDGPRVTSDGRADRCAVLGEQIQRLLRESSVFAAFM